MRRLLGASAALVVLAGGVVTADAAPRRAPETRRTVVVDYERPAAYYVACLECPRVQPRAGERYVTVEVLDEVSTVGHVDVVWQAVEADGGRDHFFQVCGRTARPQEIPPRRELTLFAWAHPAPGCTTGHSTRGKVRFTFSARP